MAITQNGWATISSTTLDTSPIPGTDVVPVPGLKAGDVATVLLHVGKLFNERVAKVYNPGCWGWAPVIPIPDTTILSNHGSGTAIDLNAPSFPWKRYTMTKEQRQACRDIVLSLDGVVDWGGDFPTNVDEMHFEISPAASEGAVASVARKIKEGKVLGANSMDLITKDDLDILRICHSEIGGWDLTKTHAGEYDKQFLSAWLGKPMRDMIRKQWVSGDGFRYARVSAMTAKPTDAELALRSIKNALGIK